MTPEFIGMIQPRLQSETHPPDKSIVLDKAYLRQLIAKAAKPTSDCLYRVLLQHDDNPPKVPGVSLSSFPFLSTTGLTARSAGTVIATGHLTAAATYWG